MLEMDLNNLEDTAVIKPDPIKLEPIDHVTSICEQDNNISQEREPDDIKDEVIELENVQSTDLLKNISFRSQIIFENDIVDLKEDILDNSCKADVDKPEDLYSCDRDSNINQETEPDKDNLLTYGRDIKDEIIEPDVLQSAELFADLHEDVAIVDLKKELDEICKSNDYITKSKESDIIDCTMSHKKYKLMCDNCNYKCYNKSKLIKHMIEHETSETSFNNNKYFYFNNMYYCNICLLYLTLKKEMKEHILGHTKKQQISFNCDKNKVRRKVDIARHMRIHKKKVIKCSICKIAPVSDDHLLNYNAKDERAFVKQENIIVCDNCKESSRRKASLERENDVDTIQQNASIIQGTVKTYAGRKVKKIEKYAPTHKSAQYINQEIILQDSLIPKEEVIDQEIFLQNSFIPKEEVKDQEIFQQNALIPKDELIGQEIFQQNALIPKDQLIGQEIFQQNALIPKDELIGQEIFQQNALIPKDELIGQEIFQQNALIPKEEVIDQEIFLQNSLIPKEEVIDLEMILQKSLIPKEGVKDREIIQQNVLIPKEGVKDREIIQQNVLISKEGVKDRDIILHNSVISKEEVKDREIILQNASILIEGVKIYAGPKVKKIYNPFVTYGVLSRKRRHKSPDKAEGIPDVPPPSNPQLSLMRRQVIKVEKAHSPSTAASSMPMMDDCSNGGLFEDSLSGDNQILYSLSPTWASQEQDPPHPVATSSHDREDTQQPELPNQVIDGDSGMLVAEERIYGINIPLNKFLADQHNEADALIKELLKNKGHDITFDWTPFAKFLGRPEIFVGPWGPTFELQGHYRPIDVFMKYFDDEIFDLLVTIMNRNCANMKKMSFTTHSRFNNLTETNKSEVGLFIAILILRGVLPLAVERNCFKEHPLGRSFTLKCFNNLIPYKRYCLLKTFLHSFGDVTVRDRLVWDYEPLQNSLNRKFCRLYLPSREVVVNESILRYNGKVYQKITKKFKSYNMRFKTYDLCELSTGYCWSSFIYTGEGSDTNELYSVPTDAHRQRIDNRDEVALSTPTNMAAKIVVNLVRPLYYRGHRLIMVNFYNSPLLARYLKLHGTDCFGTLCLDREMVPKTIKRISKALRKVGMAHTFCRDMSITLWQDKDGVSPKNQIAMISTFHSDEVGTRDNNGRYKRKPQVVLDYEISMEQLQKKDQDFTEQKKNDEWYKKLFRRLLNVTLWNAYIVYKTMNPMMTQLDFRISLANDMIAAFKTNAEVRPCHMSGDGEGDHT